MSFLRSSILATLAGLAVVAAPAGAATRPSAIALPPGFSAEAMTAHDGALYVGSQRDGEIRRIDVRSGEQTVLVSGRAGRHSNGLRFAGGRLIVAGGTTGRIYVYDALTGAPVATHDVHGGFVNAVGVLGRTAYVTDTLRHVIYALPASGTGAVRTITLSGDWTPNALDLDGIIPARGRLLTGQYGTGKLFTFAPATGVAHAVDLHGATVPTNDGLLLEGRRLYIAENSGKVQEVALSADLSSGRIVKTIPHRRLRNPVDVARIDGHLYVLNADGQRGDRAKMVDQIIDLGRV